MAYTLDAIMEAGMDKVIIESCYSIIENCYGLDDESSSAGEAWSLVKAHIDQLEGEKKELKSHLQDEAKRLSEENCMFCDVKTEKTKAETERDLWHEEEERLFNLNTQAKLANSILRDQVSELKAELARVKAENERLKYTGEYEFIKKKADYYDSLGNVNYCEKCGHVFFVDKK